MPREQGPTAPANVPTLCTRAHAHGLAECCEPGARQAAGEGNGAGRTATLAREWDQGGWRLTRTGVSVVLNAGPPDPSALHCHSQGGGNRAEGGGAKEGPPGMLRCHIGQL